MTDEVVQEPVVEAPVAADPIVEAPVAADPVAENIAQLRALVATIGVNAIPGEKLEELTALVAKL